MSAIISCLREPDTTNEKDNVFGDGYTNELATLAGSVSTGYTLTHTLVVSAWVTEWADER